MLPLDRRRQSAHWSLLFCLLLYTISTASAASAVVGIDLGTEYLKAALVKPGVPLEIVLTKDSRRKEAATIAFKPSKVSGSDVDVLPERLYGADALALSARYPGDLYPNLKTLLGLSVDSPIVKEYQTRFPGLDIQGFERSVDGSTVAFRSAVLGKDAETLMVEEILAMELKNIKTNAETLAGKGSSVTDAVVTYPAFYTAEEKRAVELAAELAGLRVLSMISDGLATGLNYATTRTFASISDGGKPEYHLVYDMGAGSTTATVLKMQGRTVKDFAKRNKTIQEVAVIGTAWDRTLGGDLLNALIVDDMVDKFVETKKPKAKGVQAADVKKDAKSMARLWKDAERVRQVLSANQQSQASFEDLFAEGYSFKYQFTRTDFERLIAKITPRVDTPLMQALDVAKISLTDLDSVILHGGAVRTPFVQKQLEGLVGDSQKLKTNVNADEAAVMGAAFKAAGLSRSFRVKEIRALDSAAYAATIILSSEGRMQPIFTPSSLTNVEKTITLKSLDDTVFQLMQTTDGADTMFEEVRADNITASVGQLTDKHGCAKSNVSARIVVRLSPVNALPEIFYGVVECDVEAKKAGSILDGVKGLFGGSKKDSEQESLIDDDGSFEEFFEEASSSTSSSSPISASSSKSSKASKSSTSSKAIAPTPTTISIPLALSSRALGISVPPTEAELTKIKDRLQKFDTSDRNRMLRSEALNSLEGYTYRARDYLSDELFAAVTTEKIRKTLEDKLSAASEWLYGDGVDAKTQEFKDRLKELRAIVDPALKRQDESKRRPQALNALRDQLEHLQSMIQMVEGSIEKAAADASIAAAEEASKLSESANSATSSVKSAVLGDEDELEDDPYSGESGSVTTSAGSATVTPMMSPYTEEDLNPLVKAYDTVSKWLEDSSAAQDLLQAYEDPTLLVSDLDAKAKSLQSQVTDLLMKNIRNFKPPPKKSSSSKKTAKATKKDKKGKSSLGTMTATPSSAEKAKASGKQEL